MGKMAISGVARSCARFLARTRVMFFARLPPHWWNSASSSSLPPVRVTICGRFKYWGKRSGAISTDKGSLLFASPSGATVESRGVKT